jgi:transposase
MMDARRRSLFEHFPRKRYGQRWQVESAISAHKRRFGDLVAARTVDRRNRELLLRGVLHNVAILHA